MLHDDLSNPNPKHHTGRYDTGMICIMMEPVPASMCSWGSLNLCHHPCQQ
jgi:hypothetical protein